ncbi:hypothetical protein NL676_000874 [Syzygium grande]|nr:hypothetical protein NL676_000874 [Syzygium grande]
MEHAISIDRSAIRATRNGRLEAMKVRNIPTPYNQQLFGDGDLNKIMDPDLYKAAKDGDADKFIDALEAAFESRRLALSLIFDQVTPSGNSLLHVAASSGNEDIVELILIHFPYLVTRKNSSDDTPLHVAVQDGRLEATTKLIRLRRDSGIIYWKNKDSKSPLYLAAETGRLEILQLLLEASARDEAYAVKIQGMSPVLAALDEGKSALHSAASIGKVGAVQLLLSKCSYLALQTDKNGSYPIHIACQSGHIDTIHELVKMWPDLAEVKNKKGQNILHVAAKGGNNNAVRYILKECGEPVDTKLVNSKDVDGNTPLHLASRHYNCHVLFFLTEDKRSDLQLRNNENLTALDVAMECRSLSTKYPAVV